MNSTIAVVLLLANPAAWPSVRAADKPVPNELPRSWSLEDIAKKVPPSATEGRVYVLAWKVIEDDRPLRVESCLVLKVCDKNKRYVLAHLYRHPMDKKSEWQIGISHLSYPKGHKYWPGLWIHHATHFDHRPSNKEVYAACLSSEEVDWEFDLEKGWRFVSCAICESSWQEAIGEKPTKQFGFRRD